MLLVMVVAAVGVVVGAAAPGEPLRLAEALARAEERGAEQAVTRAQVVVARSEVLTARMLPNPTLALGAGKSEPVFSAALQLRVPLFGQRGAGIAAAERGVEQALREAGFQRWRLRHDVRVAYYAAARGDQEALIAALAEALTGRVAEMARERFEVGAGSRLDAQQAELLHVRAEQDVSDRRTAARVARLELARLIGLPEEKLGVLVDGLDQVGPSPPLDELLRAALDRHPELRSVSAEREAALARAHAARTERRPRPTLEIGLELLDPSTCSSAPNAGRCVGPRGALSFDLPLLNLNGGPIARAEAEASLAEAKARAASLRIATAARSAYETLNAAWVRARFFDRRYVPAAVEVEAMAREGFAAGKTGLLPLLEAERAVLDARLGRTEAQFALQAARADLEEASGVPLSTP